MRKVIVACGILAVLAAGVFAYRAYLISELRKPLLAQLNDPASAQFRNEKVVGPWTVAKSIYCGEINAKNKMGGYVGYAWFTGFGQEYASIERDLPDVDYCVTDDEAVKWWWLRW